MKNVKRLSRVSLIVATLFLGFLLFLAIPVVRGVIPSGADVTPIINQTAPPDDPDSHAAIAGNVTELVLFGYTTTQSWQGYYGNVSGTIQLADTLDNVMYNWSLASPEGEVFASTNDSLLWTFVQCFNHTATGAFGNDDGNVGATSQLGLNMTQVEDSFGIVKNDSDGLNETFGYNGSLDNNIGSHDLFYVNNLLFSEGECLSSNIFRNGSGQDNYFEEVLLYDPTTRSLIFTALLEESDTDGFDEAYHDFQMLVLEDGHGTDIVTTTYYFYVEIE